MIKLQCLLRHPGSSPELEPALRALLESYGIAVTGAGRASLTAQIAEDDFCHLFGALPQLESGFAPDLQATPELAVPPGLVDAISLITIAPRHTAAPHTVR